MMITTWNETVKTALLGTNRAALPAPPNQAALGQLLTQLPPQEDAAMLLALAGTVALHQQTGWQPQQDSPPTPTPQLSDLPICPASLARQIDLLLEGPQTTLLPEILDALAQTGHRIPEFLLPNLLEKGKKLAQLRPSILSVLGTRGRWLASQNAEWRYASLEIESWAGLLAEWKSASTSQRQALLRQLRLTQPDRGRQILEQTWKSEPDPARQPLIKILGHNLTLADEPFLETALDDRNHFVRQAAADLLACLPHSRLGQRMTQHAAAILRWTPQAAHAITVSPPNDYPLAMKRDGILNVSAGDLAKTRSRQLTQILGRVPLSYWTEQWQKTPLEIAQAALNSVWPRTLVAGFTTAAVRQNNPNWAEALILAGQFNPTVGRLVPILSADTCLALMHLAAKQSTGLQRPDPLFIFLQHWQQPWQVPMGKFWLDLFFQYLQQVKAESPQPTLNTLFKRFSQKCTPKLAETAVSQLTTIPGLSSAWQKIVHDLCQTLQFRRDLLAEIYDLNQPAKETIQETTSVSPEK